MIKRQSDSLFYSYLYATVIVCLLHASFIWWLSTQNAHPPKPIQHRKFVTKTVELSPRLPSNTQPSILPRQEVASVDVKTAQIKEEITPSTPKNVEIVPEIKAPAPVKQETPKKNETPKKQETPKVKDSPKKEESPKKEPPKKKKDEPKKEEPKKNSPVNPQAKNELKPKPKPVETPPQKQKPKEPRKEVDPAPVATSVKQKPIQPSAQEIAAQEAAKTRQKELLAKAQENIAKIGQTRDKQASSSTASASSVAFTKTELPQLVGTLEIDALPMLEGSTAQLTVKEVSYRDEISYRLRRALKLPDYGTIKVKLILDRSGKVKSAVIVSSESGKNKEYVEKSISTLTFPNFGTNFGNSPEYTFMITLHNAN